MNIVYTDKISFADYAALRDSAGWPKICEKQAMAGIRGSKFMIAANDGDRAVGIARVVSDNGYIAYLADVIVSPEYHRRGIGTEMVGRLVSMVKENMNEGENINFVLLSAIGKEGFYEKFGFTTRPNEITGPGKAQWLTK